MEEKNECEITPDLLKSVAIGIVKRFDDELFSKSESEVASEWWWKWDEKMSVEWNVYEFSDMLELYKSRCEQWEKHHNGHVCVVERVRDKYLMPRIKEFLIHLTGKI